MQLQEKLKEALSNKEMDVQSFVWKEEKVKHPDGSITQNEIKLMDCTEEQLLKYYKHCSTMLYNTKPTSLGRYLIKDLINSQIDKCYAELFLRSIQQAFPRNTLIPEIKAKLSAKEINETDTIDVLFSNFEPKYRNVKIKDVFDGCLDMLGLFDKRYITFSFISRLGVWLTPDDINTLGGASGDKNIKDCINTLKETLGLQNIDIKINKGKGLSYQELSAMITLKNDKYSTMSASQLNTLAGKVLVLLEMDVNKHIKHWERKMDEITMVAKTRKIKM